MKNILVFGDSNSWGYDYTTYDSKTGVAQRLAFDERWPGRVQLALGSDYHVIENALNARLSMLNEPFFPHRCGMQSLQEALDANAPLDLVILQLGCNDIKHAFNLTAGMVAYCVEQLVLECAKSYYAYPAPKVLLIAPSPTHPKIGELEFGYVFGPDAYGKSLEFSKLYRAVAERNHCGFVDCAPMRFTLNELDGLHYCKADHAKLADAVSAKVKEMLG